MNQDGEDDTSKGKKGKAAPKGNKGKGKEVEEVASKGKGKAAEPASDEEV